MQFSREVDVNQWDWHWSWYSTKMTFTDLEQHLAIKDIRFAASPRDVTEEYVACHRILMEVANVANPSDSAFFTSAKLRANRWRPMLLLEIEYGTSRCPVVTCSKFININLLTTTAVERVKIVEAISLALEAEPKWGWGEGHRIWWCIDGARPERLEYFRSI